MPLPPLSVPPPDMDAVVAVATLFPDCFVVAGVDGEEFVGVDIVVFLLMVRDPSSSSPESFVSPSPSTSVVWIRPPPPLPKKGLSKDVHDACFRCLDPNTLLLLFLLLLPATRLNISLRLLLLLLLRLLLLLLKLLLLLLRYCSGQQESSCCSPEQRGEWHTCV